VQRVNHHDPDLARFQVTQFAEQVSDHAIPPQRNAARDRNKGVF
jgi:hypothetical protein